MSRHTMLRILTLLTVCFLHITASWCIEVNITSKPVSCNGGNDGEILLKILNASPELTIKLYDKPPAIKQKTLESIVTSDSVISFNNLMAKKYYITVLDRNNQYYSEEVQLNQPKALLYEGFSIDKYPSASDASDGSITLQVSGGTQPYGFSWNAEANNQQTGHANNLAYGVYQCEINDANNCSPLRPSIFFMKNPEIDN